MAPANSDDGVGMLRCCRGWGSSGGGLIARETAYLAFGVTVFPAISAYSGEKEAPVISRTTSGKVTLPQMRDTKPIHCVVPQNYEQSKQGIVGTEAGAEEVTGNAKLSDVKQESGFEIGMGGPVGSDVARVIACTDENALHEEIEDLAAATTKDDPYPVMTRGMSIKKAKAASKANLSAQTKWGEKHIVVSTFPKD